MQRLYLIFFRSIVAVQIDDGGPGMNGVIIEGNIEDHWWAVISSVNDGDGQSNHTKHSFWGPMQQTPIMSLMANMCNKAIMTGVVLTAAMRKLRVEPWQDDAGVGNPTVPRVENRAGNKCRHNHKQSLMAGQK